LKNKEKYSVNGCFDKKHILKQIDGVFWRTSCFYVTYLAVIAGHKKYLSITIHSGE